MTFLFQFGCGCWYSYSRTSFEYPGQFNQVWVSCCAFVLITRTSSEIIVILISAVPTVQVNRYVLNVNLKVNNILLWTIYNYFLTQELYLQYTKNFSQSYSILADTLNWTCPTNFLLIYFLYTFQYLDFDNLPETNFTCTGKVIGGYYADLETSCQMFHVCTVGQNEEPMDIKFLCLNGTVFDQVSW